MVTTPIKNFLSRAKTSLSSFLSSHSACMSLNCLACSQCRTSLNCQDTTVHIVKLRPPVSPSGCMTINCPPHCTAQSCVQSHDGPCDCPTVRTDGMASASIQNPCPDLDPSSSMDSLQTHDSLVTPESPHLPSPVESLEEGTTQEVTQVRTNDSLITALLRLSLEPDLDPLSDHQ